MTKGYRSAACQVALQTYRGTLSLVTHDRTFANAVTTTRTITLPPEG